jgi:hypothetical protein
MLALLHSSVMIPIAVIIASVQVQHTKLPDLLATASTHTIVQMLMNAPETGIIANPDIVATTIGGVILVMISTNAAN